MGKDRVTIGYFYYAFFPVKGGASVHGFNLAKELSLRGHRLIKVNGDPDPYTEKKKGILGLLYTLIVSDIIFVRIDFLIKPRNLLPILGKLLGKKVIVELNSPSDELLLFGYSKRYKKWMERWMKFLVKFADKMVVVSDKVKQFCEQILDYQRAVVLENGGEIFNEETLAVSETFKNQLKTIRNHYQKIIIWAGSGNKLQEKNKLRQLALGLDPQYALLIFSNEPLELGSKVISKKNIYSFVASKRDEVKLAMIKADIGLAFFIDYDWCRWGFYISSLKVYEYLCNRVFVLTNSEALQNRNPAITLITDPLNINQLIGDINLNGSAEINGRTWGQVAEEFEYQMKEVLIND